MKKSLRWSASLLLAAALGSGATLAQAPGVKRTLLQRIDVGNGMELVMALAEIGPGGSIGRHTHPGIETGYALSGSASLEVEGAPPKLVNAGDSYVVPHGKVHDAKVVGDAPAKVLAIYVVEKGKPLSAPAP